MRPRARSVVGTFLAGALLGGGLTTLFTAHRVDTLKVDLASTRMDLSERRAEVARLQQQVEDAHRRSAPVVRSIAVTVTGLDGPQAVDVKKAVLAVLSAVPGMALAKVDPVLFQHILDGRIVAVGGDLYLVELKAAVIAADLRITVKATPVK